MTEVPAAAIDSTLLRPDVTESELIAHCREAMDLGCAAVVVSSAHVGLAAQTLQGSKTAACATVGFPTGGVITEAVIQEASSAVDSGAEELDMCIPLWLLLEGRHGELVERVHEIADLVHQSGGTLKTIIEVTLLDEASIRRACGLCADGGADLVKTSSGYFGSPSPGHVALMRGATPAQVGIKAAGGIRTAGDASAMLQAGADRIGTSTARALLTSWTDNPGIGTRPLL